MQHLHIVHSSASKGGAAHQASGPRPNSRGPGRGEPPGPFFDPDFDDGNPMAVIGWAFGALCFWTVIGVAMLGLWRGWWNL